MKITSAVGIIYLLVGVYSFGHSASNAENSGRHYLAEKAMPAMFASTFWPLYWSWELQIDE